MRYLLLAPCTLVISQSSAADHMNLLVTFWCLVVSFLIFMGYIVPGWFRFTEVYKAEASHLRAIQVTFKSRLVFKYRIILMQIHC